MMFKSAVAIVLLVSSSFLVARTADSASTQQLWVRRVQCSVGSTLIGPTLQDSGTTQNAVFAAEDRAEVEKLALLDAQGTTKSPRPEPGAKSAPAAIKGAPVPEGYRIGAGDVLQIAVWKEPDASVSSVVVRADGRISVPLVKEVQVLGMTPAEAEVMLAEKLAQFIHGADVTVVPKEIHSQKVYLVGAVKKEGSVMLQAPTTVLQALTEAGGLTEYAKPKKIYILRQENGRQVRLLFNYQAVIKGEHMEQNITLLPGDVVVVPH